MAPWGVRAKGCSVDGCHRAHAGKALCQPHLRRLNESGDALAGAPVRARRNERGIHTLEDAFRAFMPEDPPSAGTPWLWRGPLGVHGYGTLTCRGAKDLAHRVSYRVFHGEIPAGLHVLHDSDIPADVNPHHLRTGTPADNCADKIGRGRQAVGSSLPQSKLTEAVVSRIRRRFSLGEDATALAIEYGVQREAVALAIARMTWRHVK